MMHASALHQATDTREIIVKSAYACFGKHGLQKATIVDIAKQAGVSRSTVYEYFPDKAAILEACAENASERFYREMSRPWNAAVRWRKSSATQRYSWLRRAGP
jgi:AcrR family transcriptional regulator